MQLHKGSRHLNPFTQIVWKRGRRRWMGLRAGRWIPIEQPAPWLLGDPLAKTNLLRDTTCTKFCTSPCAEQNCNLTSQLLPSLSLTAVFAHGILCTDVASSCASQRPYPCLTNTTVVQIAYWSHMPVQRVCLPAKCTYSTSAYKCLQ